MSDVLDAATAMLFGIRAAEHTYLVATKTLTPSPLTEREWILASELRRIADGKGHRKIKDVARKALYRWRVQLADDRIYPFSHAELVEGDDPA